MKTFKNHSHCGNLLVLSKMFSAKKLEHQHHKEARLSPLSRVWPSFLAED